MDEIKRLQQLYCVPDGELRDGLRLASRNYICGKYKDFHDKYAAVPFTKNQDKYVKYKPEDVASLIESLFEASWNLTLLFHPMFAKLQAFL